MFHPLSTRRVVGASVLLLAGCVSTGLAAGPDAIRARERQAELGPIAGSGRRAVTVAVPAGYRSTTIALPSGGASGDVYADPNDPDVFYITVTEGFSFFRDISIIRMELSGSGDTLGANFTKIAGGTTSATGDLSDGNERLDNLFGAPSPAMRDDGVLFVVDNDFGTTDSLAGIVGDTIVRMDDLNTDADYRDIVSSLKEAAAYATPLGVGALGFSGQNAVLDATGALYTITADGAGFGGGSEILRIADGASTQTLFIEGLDYGSGIDIDVATSTVWYGDTHYNGSFTTNTAEVYSALDGNADFDAEDGGEKALIASGLDGVNDLTWDGGDYLYVTTNTAFGFVPQRNKLVRVNLTTSMVEEFADFPQQFFQFVKGVSFDSGSASFAPFSGPNGRRLVVIDSENGINVIEPTDVSAVREWRSMEQ